MKKLSIEARVSACKRIIKALEPFIPTQRSEIIGWVEEHFEALDDPEGDEHPDAVGAGE